ncbi:MAG TPA: PQQ-dependent dehydrogenase, methanol/ethanol family [Bryobacteraceae bacterium]|nr:PQQ-dependent dehydrogenase, methanol/ethanol family [Bryobacteraceae bacterium]
MLRENAALLLFGILCLCPRLFAQQDAPEALPNPFAGNPAAIAAGKTLFGQVCQACHGPEGLGGRGPSLVSGNLSHGNRDGMIFANIRSGIPGTEMPAFSQFSTEQVWQLVAYLRSISAPSTASAADERVAGDPAAGRAVFEGKGGCLGCHQVNGVGTGVGPDLSTAARIAAEQLRGKIMNPNQAAERRGGIRRRAFGTMPATVIARTKDGREYRGVRKNMDSFSVQMVDMNGRYHSFDRAQLAELRIENKSFMPDDYSERLSAQEIENIVAYLKTLLTAELPKLAGTGGLSWERICNSGKEPQNWLSYWGDLEGHHYSALDQINLTNVKELQAQWAVQLPGDGIVQSVPIVADGLLYTTGPVGTSAEVLALDPRTGRQIWRYDRKQKVTNPYEINRVNRGVALLGNRVFFGTLDAALVALDARTGAFLWESDVADTMKGYNITSAPLVVKNEIITGVAGGEYGARGFLDAYDPATGRRLWRIDTIPARGEFGNDTWQGDSWKRGGGPTWLTGSYDPETDTLYWPVGNPGPDINADVRKGDNLFTCSVLALDPATGRRKWYYQFTPNDSHDWDSAEDMILADRVWHGQMRKLLIHADRNGVFYVLDRANGKLLSAAPFVRTNWVKSWDENGRPVTTSTFRATPEGAYVYPGLGGGTNFQAPSYDPQTGRFYLAYHDGGGRFSTGPALYEAGKEYFGMGSFGGLGAPPGQAPDTSGIMAIDVESGKVQWKFELAQNSLQAGVLATGGGIVFAGSAEGNLIALDAKTGKALWHFGTGASIPSSPMSYAVDGRQYVAISSANVLYSFAIPE